MNIFGRKVRKALIYDNLYYIFYILKYLDHCIDLSLELFTRLLMVNSDITGRIALYVVLCFVYAK